MYPPNQTDPITGNLYSIDNDVTCFEILDQCICGNKLLMPIFDEVEISDTPAIDTDCFLLGFPGNDFEVERVLPHAPELGTLLPSQKFIMKPDTLVITKGMLIASGYLIGVITPSIAGMSGSPIMYKDRDKWKIFSLLIGGPSVEGHRELIEIIRLFNERNADVSLAIENLKYLKPFGLFDYYRNVLTIVLNYLPADFLVIYKNFYYNYISKLYESEKLTIPESKMNLNHNLAIQLVPFIFTIP